MGFLLLVFTCCMKCAIKTLAMNQSYSESDVSLSPTQILERLHLLRQLQLLQQDKLLQQRQLYQESPRNSSITEVVSQFSASTSFNTFRSLLSSESSTDPTPRLHSSKSQLNQQDLVEGVAVLNLSQESEFIITSPISSRSKASNASQAPTESGTSAGTQSLAKKQISLDDMPVLTPKKDFEALIIEKLKNELDAPKPKILQKEGPPNKSKKPFLKRGEGLTRFGLQKNKPVIQSTYALPWKKASDVKKGPEIVKNTKSSDNSKRKSVNVQIVVSKPRPEAKKKPADDKIVQSKEVCDKQANIKTQESVKQGNNKQLSSKVDSSNCELHGPKPPSPPKEREIKLQLPTGKHPILANKGKTWAAVLTKEQDDFLRQLKQSDYYKNFTSPAKSILSDISCDETLIKLRQEREMAEQNMFELLENKVDRESFNLNNSFINRFLQGSSLEYSGDSTPVIMQRCLASNPKLMTLYPNIPQTRNETCRSDVDCNSEYTECCSDACSSECSCSCNNTIEESNNQHDIPKSNKNQVVQNNKTNKTTKEADKQPQVEQCHNDKEIDSMTENMAEMNAKLVATSELLKDRLRELEDEIETFRKENTNLTKMREEIDMEKQKFYEEKSTFEQKFNEEKILSEYYLAEEKEKLTKQKQIYERQVREMRGRLNKKDKDEVVNLKKEISDLKEEMRLKDAKYTTVAARLRNQLKIMEKEKKDLQEEVEKLKKENRRIQHSNDITRRMTNMKYLEEINKKLSKAKSAQAQVVQDADMKYKTLEMERQSRSRVQAPKNTLRVRAKSVPNLNVTSRYAKYFSQRDVMSPTERNHTLNIDRYPSDDIDDDDGQYERQSLGDTESLSGREASDNENDNSLEKIYMERFQEHSKDEPTEKPRSSYSSSNHSFEKTNVSQKHDTFFIHRSNSGCTRESKSPKLSPHSQPIGSISNRSKSPVSILSHRSHKSLVPVINHEPDYLPSSSRSNHSQGRSTSPMSTVTNRTYSCSSQRMPTVINREYLDNRTLEPLSKSSITKTDLTPTEIRKPDGSKELRFPNGNVKHLSADGKYSKFVYYNGDVKENFYNEGRIKYYYAETKTYHTTHPDGLEVLEFPDGQVEKRYKDGSSEIRLPNGTVRYFDPKNPHVREEWRFPDGATLTASASGERRVVFPNGQVEVHTKDHKRREFPDGTVKLVYNDGTAETRYASGRVRIKDKHGNLIMDSVPS